LMHLKSCCCVVMHCTLTVACWDACDMHMVSAAAVCLASLIYVPFGHCKDFMYGSYMQREPCMLSMWFEVYERELCMCMYVSECMVLYCISSRRTHAHIGGESLNWLLASRM
jgi:hypothetical protein